MNIKLPFFKKKKKTKTTAPKPRSIIDIKVSQISRNLALSQDHLQHIYVPIFKRLEVLLLEVNESDNLEIILDGLVEMMAYRRGKSLPSGILAEQIQRYREISSFSLTISVLSRVIAHSHAQYAIECEEHGCQKFHNPLFTNQIKAESNIVGVVKAQHAVIGSRTERYLAQWVAHDLLSNCPTGLSWYSSFPDMLALTMESTNGTESGLLGQITDKYVDVILQSIKSNSIPTQDSTMSNATPSINPMQSPSSPPSEPTTEKKESHGGGVLFLNKMLEAEPEGAENNNATNSMIDMLSNTKSMKSAPKSKPHFNTSASTSEIRQDTQPDSPPSSAPTNSAAMSGLLKLMGENNGDNSENSESELNEKDDLAANANSGLNDYFNKIKSDFLCEVRLVEKDNNQLLAIPIKTNREVIVSLFKHLGTEARKNAEEALMVDLKKVAVDEVSEGPRLKSFSTTQGEKVNVFTLCAENEGLISNINEFFIVNEW